MPDVSQYTLPGFETYGSLLQALEAANLSPPTGMALPENQWIRYPDPQQGKPGSKSAWLFRTTAQVPGLGTVELARFGSWWREATATNGQCGPWSWASHPIETLPFEQQEALRAVREAADTAYSQHTAAHREEAAQRARALFDGATPLTAPEHPYTARKGFDARVPVHVADGVLLVPMLSVVDDQLMALVRIGADGSKRNLGSVTGCACRIGAEPGMRAWLCEGFATGLSVFLATAETTYSVGPAHNIPLVLSALRQRYPGTAFALAADNDDAGRSAARDVGPDVRVVFPPVAGEDWDDVRRRGGDVRGLLLGSVAVRTEPDPLRRELPPADSYPVDALGPVLSGAVAALRRVIQAPEALIAQSVLAAAALCAQPHANIFNDGRVIPLSLFLLTIGASGERKSAVDRVCLAPVEEYQRELVERHREAAANHAVEAEAYARQSKELVKAKKEKVADMESVRRLKEGMQEALAKLGAPPEAPLLPNLLASEPTPEGLFKLFERGQPSLGLFSDEGGLFIGGHAMQQDSLLRTVTTLSKLWDGRPLDRVRGGDGSAVLYGRRLSLHMMVQPKVAGELLNNPMCVEQGFLSRFLVTWPDTTAGSRLYVDADVNQDPAVRAYRLTLSALLRKPPPLREGERNELAPPNLVLSAPAKAVWVQYHNATERRLGPGGDLEPVRALASKAAEMVLRIAGVLALVQSPNTPAVAVEHVQAGTALVDYYLAEALRIQAAAVEQPDLRLAEKLLAWAQPLGRVHLREIYRLGPNAIRDADTAKRICRVLETHGWFVPVEGGAVVDGAHRRMVWNVSQTTN